jgi:lipopolysaccharide transport protein LptA
MVAIGNVDSALYSVDRRQESDKGESNKGKSDKKRDPDKGQSDTGQSDKERDLVPAFASAEHMNYSDADRRVHYIGGVKARQGSDRIDADSVEVFLMKETNEVERLTADGNVVLNQPGRRGTGDNLVYTGADGRAILKGKTARVEDDEKGVTMGAQLTFYSRDDKVFVDNQHGTGRVRSVHRLGKGKAK